MATQNAIEGSTPNKANDSWLKNCIKTIATLVTTSSAKTVERDFLRVNIKSNGVTLDLDSLLSNRAVTRQVDDTERQ